jgi:SAM-dependent methyltransferase
MEKSAYLLSDVDVAGQELRRLSAQAQLFLDLELPFLLGEIPAQARVADFGCGTGAIAGAVAQARPLASVWGLDADPLAVEQSRTQNRQLKNLQFDRYAVGLGQACPVQNLDLAFTRLVLLHVPDPVRALQDMGAALAPGGKLYVVETDDAHMRFDPAEAWQEQVLDLLERVQVGRGGSRRRGAEMGGLMQRAGLRPQPLATVHYCKSRIRGPVFAGLFMPVASFYLQEAARLGYVSAHDCAELLSAMQAYILHPETEVDMALFHWCATKENRG